MRYLRAGGRLAAFDGHFPFSEEPAAFQAAVGKFLTRPGRSGPPGDPVRR